MPYVGNTPVEHKIEDAKEIIRMLGQTIERGTIEKNAVLDNLFHAMRKLEDALNQLKKK